VRVHPEFLVRQRIPDNLVTKDVWRERIEDIAAFERHQARNGMRLLKFFLHVSKEEQEKRLVARLDDPDKNWKFELGDVRERSHWAEYMSAYEDMIRATSSPQAPWYVIPGDNKWFTRLSVASAVIDAIAALDLQYPRLDRQQRDALKAARVALLAEKGRD